MRWIVCVNTLITIFGMAIKKNYQPRLRVPIGSVLPPTAQAVAASIVNFMKTVTFLKRAIKFIQRITLLPITVYCSRILNSAAGCYYQNLKIIFIFSMNVIIYPIALSLILQKRAKSWVPLNGSIQLILVCNALLPKNMLPPHGNKK